MIKTNDSNDYPKLDISVNQVMAKEYKEGIRIDLKFENAFPDYKNVIEEFSEGNKTKHANDRNINT